MSYIKCSEFLEALIAQLRHKTHTQVIFRQGLAVSLCYSIGFLFCRPLFSEHTTILLATNFGIRCVYAYLSLVIVFSASL